MARAIRLSRAAMRNIRQNQFWVFTYNSALSPVAMGVLVPPGGPQLSPMLGGQWRCPRSAWWATRCSCGRCDDRAARPSGRDDGVGRSLAGPARVPAFAPGPKLTADAGLVTLVAAGPCLGAMRFLGPAVVQRGLDLTGAAITEIQRQGDGIAIGQRPGQPHQHHMIAAPC